jgi:coenzyme F420 hydrogenase subunit beta
VRGAGCVGWLYDGAHVHGPRAPLRKRRADLPELAWEACPGKGVDYPKLYRDHYGALPGSWLVGPIIATRTGYAADPAIRARGASGGVTTAVLLHLLESGRVDAAIVVRQGVPAPREASAVMATSRDEIIAAAQSVYIPVSVLDILPRLEPGKRYAVTLVPEQAAALRRLQASGHEQARQIEWVLGPYTGTALYPAAIDTFLRSNGVKRTIRSPAWNGAPAIGPAISRSAPKAGRCCAPRRSITTS